MLALMGLRFAAREQKMMEKKITRRPRMKCERDFACAAIVVRAHVRATTGRNGTRDWTRSTRGRAGESTPTKHRPRLIDHSSCQPDKCRAPFARWPVLSCAVWRRHKCAPTMRPQRDDFFVHRAHCARARAQLLITVLPVGYAGVMLAACAADAPPPRDAGRSRWFIWSVAALWRMLFSEAGTRPLLLCLPAINKAPRLGRGDARSLPSMCLPLRLRASRPSAPIWRGTHTHTQRVAPIQLS